MIKAIFEFLANITGWGLWERKRAAARADDPQNKYEKARRENSRIVTEGDAAAANAKLDDRLNRLQKHANQGDPG